eukprot:CAMPEP_0114250432 /NCGR_PEP_ID=MMETSP0058-20121206/14695_1 /TAXON_ID=36894 /ORGANISM="Pyramimonas parkeae, CCMP726" /LENGTH=162 /DNA_ID=CAMNT_0001364089 /DNA_START=259 /DNA_END=747 /DNA_ORIENTATION=+
MKYWEYHKRKVLKWIPPNELPEGHPRRPKALGGGGVKLTSRCHKSPTPKSGEGWREYEVGYQGCQQLYRLPKDYMVGMSLNNHKEKKRKLMKRLFVQLEAEKRKRLLKASHEKRMEERKKRWADRAQMRIMWMERASKGLPMPKRFNINKYFRELPESQPLH